jgi:hypothetical protein
VHKGLIARVPVGDSVRFFKKSPRPNHDETAAEALEISGWRLSGRVTVPAARPVRSGLASKLTHALVVVARRKRVEWLCRRIKSPISSFLLPSSPTTSTTSIHSPSPVKSHSLPMFLSFSTTVLGL